MNILEQFKNVYSNHLIPKGFSLLKSNPLMKLIRERKEKEFKEKQMEYNQWFIDRKKVVRNMTSIWRTPLRMRILIENILRN